MHQTAPRILITRLSAIGDCVHTLPLVAALRARFPEGFIGWATQRGGASMIEGLDGLNALIVVPRDWMKSWNTIRSTRAELRSHRFDISIDPQSLTKSSMLGWLSGAKQRVGFSKGQAREISPYLNTIRVTPEAEHVVDRYLELLRPLGIGGANVAFNVPSQRASEKAIECFLMSEGLHQRWGRHSHSGPVFALLNPGAGWNSKLWPHKRYAEVAQHLHTQHHLRSVVLWAGDRERTSANEIVARSAGHSILAPDTSLPELAALCRRAAMFVGSDTGPMHLAAAVGIPCVAMYGPTRISVCGPYGAGHEALQTRYQDGTSAQRRGDDNGAMQAINAVDVCEACDRIVARRGRSQVA